MYEHGNGKNEANEQERFDCWTSAAIDDKNTTSMTANRAGTGEFASIEEDAAAATITDLDNVKELKASAIEFNNTCYDNCNF